MQPAEPARLGFAVIDVETTGLRAASDRIVEVGVVLLSVDGTEEGSFCTLLDPGRDPGRPDIHGITAEMVAGAPSFADVHPYLAATLSGRALVGHNVVGFDARFLRAECRRLGTDLVPPPLATVDTLSVAQRYLDVPGRATLDACCDHVEIEWTDQHHAMADARAVAALFAALRQIVGDGVLGIATVLAAGADCTWPGGSTVGQDELRPRAVSAG